MFKYKASSIVRISVVIAIRNEKPNIRNLLNDLVKQDYKNSHFEIIICDDHSDDRGADLVNEFIQYHKNIKLLSLNDKESGKKAALAKAIQSATGELIISTDGDCRVRSEWIRSIAEYYDSTKANLILGPVIYNSGMNTFKILQNTELTGLMVCTGGAAMFGVPIMSNGANIAFRKDDYLELKNNIKSDIASGDDIFLLQAMKQNKKKIRFIKSKHSIVCTEATNSLKDFIYQRIRWSSKTKHYSDKFTFMIASVVYFTNLLFILLPILYFFDFINLSVLIFIALQKLLSDFILLTPGAAFFNKPGILLLSVIIQPLYSLYVVITGLLSFFKSFTWKGRLYNS